MDVPVWFVWFHSYDANVWFVQWRRSGVPLTNWQFNQFERYLSGPVECSCVCVFVCVLFTFEALWVPDVSNVALKCYGNYDNCMKHWFPVVFRTAHHRTQNIAMHLCILCVSLCSPWPQCIHNKLWNTETMSGQIPCIRKILISNIDIFKWHTDIEWFMNEFLQNLSLYNLNIFYHSVRENSVQYDESKAFEIIFLLVIYHHLSTLCLCLLYFLMIFYSISLCASCKSIIFYSVYL